MNALSLFSGIGGIDLACDWAGIKTVAFCEREPFCQKVLTKHWPGIPIYDDVCTLTKERLEADGIGAIDLIHGGYPCQPFSTAGERKGKEDHRHLWPEVRRLIEAIRPRWFVGENVAGHVSLGLDDVLSDLGNLGYAAQSFIVPASSVGAPHRRDRVFIVANSDRIGCMEYKGFAETIQPDWHEKLQREKGEQSHMQQPLYGSDEDVAHSHSVRLQGAVQTGDREAETGRIDQRSSAFRTSAPRGGLWEPEPSVGRVAHGIPNRVDRLKALGNAVVPQQIFPILAAIKQLDEMVKEGSK